MFCTKCGSQIAPGNKFCTVCGNPVSADAEDAPGKPRFLDEPESVPEESPESVPEENPDETYASPKIESKKKPRPPKKKLSGGKIAAIIISLVLAVIIGLGVTGFILIATGPKKVVDCLDEGEYKKAKNLYNDKVRDNVLLNAVCRKMLNKQFDIKSGDFVEGEMKYDEAIKYFSAILKMKVFDKDEITEKMIEAIYARCNALREGNIDENTLEELYALIEFGEDKLDGFDRSCMTEPKPVEPTPEPQQKTEAPVEPTETPAPPVEVKDNRVVVGLDTEASGNWAFAFDGSNIATDNAIIGLTNDCDTVVVNKDGDYIINDNIVENYDRTENMNYAGELESVTYTFKIREGLVFSDGSPIKAENFLIWTLFVYSPTGREMGSRVNGWMTLPGGYEYFSGDVNYLEGLRLIDDYTFSITQTAETYYGDPNLPYYYELGGFGASAINIPYWFDANDDYDWHVKDDGDGAYIVCGYADIYTEQLGQPVPEFNKDNISPAFYAAQWSHGGGVYTGPYKLVRWDKSSAQATLEINENYNGNYEGKMPNIKQIVIVKAVQETVVDALKTGEIELYPQITDGDQVTALLDAIDAGEIDGDHVEYDRAGFGYVMFMCDFGPTQWKEFRQAFAYLLNRNEFANTFCKGWGNVVHGPYGAAFTMYKDNKEYVESTLNHYDFNPEKAVELLKEIGFVYNEDGTDYVDGSKQVRYKKVTAEEAQYYEAYCKDVDGQLYMPAFINWCSTTNNSVSELLQTMVAEGDPFINAGIRVVQNAMSFPDLIENLYRMGNDPTPRYNMFNLATSWSANVFDDSYGFTTNPDFIADYNVTRLLDEQLDKLSMDMVYTVPSGDYEGYVEIWKQYIVRWNELLPQLPLYSNTYVTIYPTTITGYEESPFWGWNRAILYADFVG